VKRSVQDYGDAFRIEIKACSDDPQRSTEKLLSLYKKIANKCTPKMREFTEMVMMPLLQKTISIPTKMKKGGEEADGFLSKPISMFDLEKYPALSPFGALALKKKVEKETARNINAPVLKYQIQGAMAAIKYPEPQKKIWQDIANGLTNVSSKNAKAIIIARRLKLPVSAIQTIRKNIL